MYVQRVIHWRRGTHTRVSNLTIIGSYDGLSPGRRQAEITCDMKMKTTHHALCDDRFLFQTYHIMRIIYKPNTNIRRDVYKVVFQSI